MKRNHIFSIVGIIIIALIILIIVLPGKEKKAENQSAEELATFATPEAFAGEADMVYSFDAIQWDLNLIEGGSARVPETRVGFYFENFTRHENALAAAFKSPFHLGLYKGECVVLETLPANDALSTIEGSFIAGIACMWDEEASIVLLAQSGNLVTAYDMSSKDPKTLTSVREIDITKIVE